MAKAKTKKVKLKSNRGAAKRFRKSAGGFKHRGTGRNHILTKKGQKRKRNLRGSRLVNASDEKSIERLLHGS
jgi:large subunit ribosomal protein L35